MRTLLSLLLAADALSAAAQDLRPSIIANDASCDIALQPAATLLIPYFEVDTMAPVTTATTTIFTVTNVSPLPQIANVTLWTTLDRPVMSFPIFLTGYDVQPINVHDLIVRGRIAPPFTGTYATTPGARSAANEANPRFLPSAAQQCSKGVLPTTVPDSLLSDVRAALTSGRIATCPGPVGVPDARLARGYITIDLVATCTTENATSPAYWDVLLYDNVLMADWQILAPNPATGNYAGGNPAVHIRAVPEGGDAGSLVQSSLPFTFYDRLLPGGRKRTDRRQPLPSTFASRFIQASASSFDTELLIWRESVTAPGGPCDLTVNEAPAAEVVRFDERENPTARLTAGSTLPVAGSIGTSGDFFPPTTPGDVAGWLYVNLNNGGSTAYSANARYDMVSDTSTVRGFRQSQAWVTTRMTAAGRYAVAFDATALGNGCTPAPPSPTMATAGARLRPIGPAPGHANDSLPAGSVTHHNDDSCDIALQPAATLLLPYFQVDVAEDPNHATTTLITVVNTSDQPQIARATLWTTWAFPVLTFDIFLTGYDVQAINLYDLLVRGVLPGTGSRTNPAGARSAAANPHFLPSAQSSCGNLPSLIPPSLLADVRSALTRGLIASCGAKQIGGTSAAATGYMTVDLVATCSSRTPATDGAIEELLFDNVLTGDYELLDPRMNSGNYAFGSPLVHIRAIPEGGSAGEVRETKLGRTFYDHFYGNRDRRQPLPSTFAARYIQNGGSSFATRFAVWVETEFRPKDGCSGYWKNSAMTAVETVRFDERENPVTLAPSIIIPEQLFDIFQYPAASLTDSAGIEYPPLESGDVAGWMYFNLADLRGFNREKAPRPRQAWVVSTMSAEGRYGVAFDTTALANGCSPPRYTSDRTHPIQP